MPCMGFVVTEAGNALGGSDLSDYPVFEGDQRDFAVVIRLTWVDPEAGRGGSRMFDVLRCMSATFPDSVARHVHFLFAGLHPGGTLTIDGQPVASVPSRK